MNRLIASALAASVTIALPATAFAETLDYDFTMKVNQLTGDPGVFGDLELGDTIHVSVVLDTVATGDGDAQINVAEVVVTAAGNNTWSGAQSWTQGQNGSEIVWQANSGVKSASLQVNTGPSIEGTYQQNLWVNFSEVAGGELAVNTGWIELRVGNHVNGFLHADYVTSPPTSVPELDPKSGTGAIALLVGGMALAFSRRRRQQCDGVAG